MTYGLYRDRTLISLHTSYETAAVARYNLLSHQLLDMGVKIPKYEIIDINSRNCESCPECMVLIRCNPAPAVPDLNSETCRHCLFEGD